MKQNNVIVCYTQVFILAKPQVYIKPKVFLLHGKPLWHCFAMSVKANDFSFALLSTLTIMKSARAAF